MPTPRSRRSAALALVYCRARWRSPTAPSRATSRILLTCWCRSRGGLGAALSRRSWRSSATTLRPTATTWPLSLFLRRHRSMSPESSFYDHLEDGLRQAREHEAAEAFDRRHRAERDDREFVRAALQGAVPEDEIERRLLLRSEFVRLNPDRDSHAYARGLIEEEKTSFHALSTPVPPSVEDTVTPQSQQPRAPYQPGTDSGSGPRATSKRHATDRAETAEGAPH